LTLRPAWLWRLLALALWIASLGCLAKAIDLGAATELGQRAGPIADVAARTSIAADHWAGLGWALQIAAAIALAVGVESKRVSRKVFVALGVLIAGDGVLMLLVAVIVR
jgi:hypothetical protein